MVYFVKKDEKLQRLIRIDRFLILLPHNIKVHYNRLFKVN